MIKKTLKLLGLVFLVTAVVLIAFQVYRVFKPSYVTERAVLYTMPDSVACFGIAIRDEKTIEMSSSGTLSFKVNDGQKVAANSVVANVYSSATIAEDVMIYDLLLNERDTLLKAKSAASNSSLNLDSVSNYVQQTSLELSRSIANEDYSESSLLKLKLIEQLYTFSLNINENLSIDSSIEKLNQEIGIIEGRMSQSIDEITISQGGYFVSYTDSLEYLKYRDGEIVKSNGLDEESGEETYRNLSVEDIYSLISLSENKPNYNSCKIISDYTWYFAAIVEGEAAERFWEGQNLSLDFEHFYEKNLPVKVTKIITDGSSTKAIILFSCDRLNEELAGLRIAEGNISFRNYTGIRVPRSAIYIIDGEVGVFIKYDNKMQFKKITYNFETPEYVLVNTSTNYDELRLYDEIIIEGKDLQNGKGM